MKIWFSSFILFFSFLSPVAASEVHSVIVCENSLEKLDYDIALIKQAKQSIEFSPCLCGGTVFKRVLTAFEEKLRSSSPPQIYVIGSEMFLDAEDKMWLARLQKEFPKHFHIQFSTSVLSFLPDIAACDNHVKCLIVDETYFSVGGTNCDEVLCTDGRYTPPRNPARAKAGLDLPGGPAGVRDQDIVVKGPAVKELRKMFFRLYATWKDFCEKGYMSLDDLKQQKDRFYYPLDTSIATPVVSEFETSSKKVEVEGFKLLLSGPFSKTNPISDEYVRLIENAKEHIVIGNIYISPTSAIEKALLNAVNRGVRVTLITNGVGENAPEYTSFFAWANRIVYVPLFLGKPYKVWNMDQAYKAKQKDVSIYEYNIKDVVYHKKVMIVDGKHFLIGSYNLGIRSHESDFELNVSIVSQKAALEALNVFETDLGNSVKVSLKDALKWYFDPRIFYMGSVQKKIHVFL